MSLILGNDSSWTGWGWCLATSSGPITAGHIPRLGGAAWRWARLVQELAILDQELTEATATLPPGELPRVVVERAPAVYAGRGNQAATGQGMGQLSGAILVWATRPGRLAYPWEIVPGPGGRSKPTGWRSWWLQRGARRPRGRTAWKLWAVKLVELMGWGSFLEPWEWTGDDGGARADVAEAILIAVGAARNSAQAPKGPSHARSPEWRPL